MFLKVNFEAKEGDLSGEKNNVLKVNFEADERFVWKLKQCF